MEFQKVVNLLDITSDDKDLARYVTKKWIEVYDKPEKKLNYINKEIRIKTSMLRPDLCDFSDAHVVVKRDITVDKKTSTVNDFRDPNNTEAIASATNNANNNDFNRKKLIFKNNAPFTNCITNINGIKTNNAEELDVVMSMYNLLEYSKNYKNTTQSWWNYYRDEPNSDTDNNNITHTILNSKSFDYKANFISNVTHNNLTKNDVKIVIPLKYISNFWKNLNMPLINCEVELMLSWFKNCVLIDKSTRKVNYANPPIIYEIDNPENATFQITDTKLYVPVVTLSKENDIKLLEKLKSGFKKLLNGTNIDHK